MSLFVLSMLCSPVWADDSSGGPLVAFDIPRQRADLALTEFAEQADLTLVFPSDVAREKLANPLIGEYTLEEGVRILLSGTGLNPAFSSRVVLSVAADEQSADGGRDVQASKKAGLLAVLAGVFAGEAAAQGASALSEQPIGTSVVTGRVTDVNTGANLKGAKVTIEETGQWTSTNDLGEFRLVSVPIGSATLTVSYLGYAGQTAVIGIRGGSVTQNFSLRGGTEVEEIVVFGQRSARALALNQERTAENLSIVISADDLGNFTGTTLSESLRRFSGITFQRDADGNGSNIVIRGLSPELNAVKLNGIELPVGDGGSRSASLDNILTDSISKVTIHKSLLPSHDTAGTGGLVEIETASPLDRPRRFADFGVEAAQRGDDFYDDFGASLRLSGVFGDSDNVGLGVTIQYRDTETSRISYFSSGLFGPYLPLEQNGFPARFLGFVDPRLEFPFESGVDEFFVTTSSQSIEKSPVSNLTASLSGEIRFQEHTNLHFNYFTTVEESDLESRSSGFSDFVNYSLLPVQALLGEERFALNRFNLSSSRKDFIVENGSENRSSVVSIKGLSNNGPWEFEYLAGFTEGELKRPFRLSAFTSLNEPGSFGVITLPPEFVSSAAIDPDEGRILSLFGQRRGDSIPQPLLTPTGFEFLNNPASYELPSGEIQLNSGVNERRVLETRVRRSFANSNFDYLEAGIDFEESEFATLSNFVSISSAAADLSVLGLSVGSDEFSRAGLGSTIDPVSASSVQSFISNLSSLENQNVIQLTPNMLDPLERLERTVEESIEGYVQAGIQIGDVEIVGGVRVSQIETTATIISRPQLFDESFTFDADFASQFLSVIDAVDKSTSVLPRLVVNFRPDNNLVVRGGYYQSLARPSIFQLSSAQNLAVFLAPVFGPNGDVPSIQVTQGNPGLEPSKTDNFDVGFEYYDDNLGVIKANVFYKRIENLLESNVTSTLSGGTSLRSQLDLLRNVSLPNEARVTELIEQEIQSPGSIFISLTTPVNSEDAAEIWGIEASFERQFVDWPGLLGGVGVFSNVTYTDSEKVQSVPFAQTVLDGTGVPVDVAVEEISFRIPFNSQPEWSGTLGVTYNQENVDIGLFYTRQDRVLFGGDSFIGRGLNRYSEDVETLDFRFDFRVNLGSAQSVLYIEVEDMLKSSGDADLLTALGGEGATPRYVTNGTYLGGRTFRAGFRSRFE